MPLILKQMPLNPKQKFFLFKQSEHFCSVPWNHFEIFTDGSVKTCSKGKYLGNINDDPIEKILVNDKFVEIRRDVLANKSHVNCIQCKNLTTTNEHFDLRNHYNPMFKGYDIDYTDLTAFELHGVDLHWDNTCNFKCVYCKPSQSSSIAQEQKIPALKSNIENINKIIELIVKNQYEMKEIYFSGGEPLLIKHNKKLLEQIENKDLPIRINSNISFANNTNDIFVELKKFKNVLWTVSADNQGAKFNYTRQGGDWNKFLANLETIRNTGHQVRINSVFFVANVVDIFDTIKFFIDEYDITDITINQITELDCLLARNAPQALKDQSMQHLLDLLDIVSKNSNSYYNIARCQKELDKPVEDSSGYINYFDHLDQLRGTNWRTVFPELVV